VALLTAATVVADGQVLEPGWLETRGDRVLAVGAGNPGRAADRDLAGCVVAPGFVDMHVHGGGGGAYTSADVDEAARAARFHRRHGTTSTLASLVSASPESLERSVDALADLVHDGLLAGIHLEGPWLSAQRSGAHDRGQLRDPDPVEQDRLLRAGRGAIRMVTLAPELVGGLDAVHRLADAGAIPAIGHTDASYDLTREAIAAGARVGTHLFNGMPPLHHREPGPVLALLEEPAVTVEVVADGVHLHPALLRHVIGAAGCDRVALVTDAMAAAGMPDGRYRLGALDVEVSDRVARLPDTGTIAGSTATMDQLFGNAVRYSDRPRPAALLDAAAMTARTPARALGLTDVGYLHPGHRADLVVLDGELHVVAVMTAGRWSAQPGSGG
jgi:N-acetylglucosamine-6-phosphate deacetylase